MLNRCVGSPTELCKLLRRVTRANQNINHLQIVWTHTHQSDAKRQLGGFDLTISCQPPACSPQQEELAYTPQQSGTGASERKREGCRSESASESWLQLQRSPWPVMIAMSHASCGNTAVDAAASWRCWLPFLGPAAGVF